MNMILFGVSSTSLFASGKRCHDKETQSKLFYSVHLLLRVKFCCFLNYWNICKFV